MNSEQYLKSISDRLGVLIALQLRTLPEQPSLSESIELLHRLGLNSSDTADILGTSKGTVDVTKSRIKSKKK